MCIGTSLAAPLVAQMVKNAPVTLERWVQFPGWEDPLEEGMAIHSSILPWRIPWKEEPGGLQSIGSPRVGHDWATNTHTQSCNYHNHGKEEFHHYPKFLCAPLQLILGSHYLVPANSFQSGFPFHNFIWLELYICCQLCLISFTYILPLMFGPVFAFMSNLFLIAK